MNHQKFTELHGAVDETEFFCKCCKQKLNSRTMVWLEKSISGRLATKPGIIASDDSQGWFTYGSGCARRWIAALGITASSR